MEFDQKFIYLKNIYQVEELDKNILPGFIIGKYMNKYHILGMNTSNIIEIKNNGEENNENAENNKNEEAFEMMDPEKTGIVDSGILRHQMKVFKPKITEEEINQRKISLIYINKPILPIIKTK